MRNRLFLLICLVFTAWTATFADGDHDDIAPEVFAAQEAQTSAHNFGEALCHKPGYTCKSVGKDDNWSELFPNFQEREKVMRLNRMNVALMYKNWIVVPDNIDKASYLSFSPLPQQVDTHGKKLILVDLGLFAFGAYDPSGKLVYWGPVGSGETKCDDEDKSCQTIMGHFKVYRMRGEDCTSSEFPLETTGGAPMPYCLYFHDGFAIHGSTLSGFINRSRGCVRLFYDDAKWLYEQFANIGTEVIVRNSWKESHANNA